MLHKFVIWDIDGTLLNTKEGLSSAYKYTIATLKLPLKTDEEISSFIGPTPPQIFNEQFGLPMAQAKEAATVFRNRYKNFELLKACPYEGILNVLQRLQQNEIIQTVATNKRQDYAEDICHHFELDKFCQPICGIDDEGTLCKADLIKQCLDYHNITDFSKAVMIGDTNNDKIASEQVGIDFIGVNYGFGFHNVEGYANYPQEILDILEGPDNAKFRK